MAFEVKIVMGQLGMSVHGEPSQIGNPGVLLIPANPGDKIERPNLIYIITAARPTLRSIAWSRWQRGKHRNRRDLYF